MKWTLKQIADWTHAEVLASHEHNFNEIGTDTRKKLTGQVFIALKGDQFDAHEYLDQAVEAGAAALIVHSFPEKFNALKEKVSILLVDDTLEALQNFAQGYRQTLQTKIIGITGSNGKTTTKEFTAQILSANRKVHHNQGSFNNHWGVPMTLLGVPTDADVAVVEMGMNHAGEIQRLVEIADPDVVVCTMVGSAHIGYFGSQKKIAEAKSEIYMYSRPDAVRVFNQDQDLTFDMMYPVAKKFPNSRMLSFSEKNTEADVFFKIDEMTMRDLKISGFIAGVSDQMRVPVFGKQNLVNLMAAATVAYASGMPSEQIWKALPRCQTSWGRNQFIETESGAEILFDGYNANPDSMKALLKNVPLLKATRNKIAVFGQMKELGDEAPKAHFDLGVLAAQAGFAQIYFIGEFAKNFEEGLNQAQYKNERFIQSTFDNQMGEKLGASFRAGDVLVVKGSRGAETERFIPFCKPKNWRTD